MVSERIPESLYSCCICGQSLLFFFFFYSLLTAAFISFMQREFTVNAGGFNYAYIGFI